MKLQSVLDLPDLSVLVKGNPDREVSKVFCCDLLSIAMGKAPADGVWVTVMGNKNTLAVATLTDTAVSYWQRALLWMRGLSHRQKRKGLPFWQQTFLSSIWLWKSMKRDLHDSAIL